MQRSLSDPSNAAPSPARGYAPVLQDHGGERDALAALRGNLPSRTAAITPVIQIVGGNKWERRSCLAPLRRLDLAPPCPIVG
jgi:hypothetical protein